MDIANYLEPYPHFIDEENEAWRKKVERFFLDLSFPLEKVGTMLRGLIKKSFNNNSKPPK